MPKAGPHRGIVNKAVDRYHMAHPNADRLAIEPISDNVCNAICRQPKHEYHGNVGHGCSMQEQAPQNGEPCHITKYPFQKDQFPKLNPLTYSLAWKLHIVLLELRCIGAPEERWGKSSS